MATITYLKKIAKARVKTINILLNARDWHAAAYMMGYALECALKAAICSRLNLINYPEYTQKPGVDSFFMTHRFDQLLFASGLEHIFSARGPAQAWNNWSEFTLDFRGDWTAMRYDPSNPPWDEARVRERYENLFEPVHGIITIIKKRW